MKISTEEIKELLKECAAQMEECRPQDFRQYIRLHSDKDCTDGQLAGADGASLTVTVTSSSHG